MERPHLRLHSLKGVSGTTAVGLVAGTVVALIGAAAPASAATISKSLNVHCNVPVAGPQPFTAKVSATYPDNVAVGSSVALSNFKISLLINSTTTDALQTLGATTLQGSITAGASLTNATPSALAITATVPTTAVPQTTNPDGTAPTFTINATGPSPSATITAAGTATLTATTIATSFNPKNAAGTSVLPVAKQAIACTYDAGQSLALTSFTTTTISKQLKVHCTIPVAGPQAYTATVTANAPVNPTVGSVVSLSNFKISLLINSDTTDALQTLGATTLQGTINAAASLTHATPSALAIAATVPTTAIPQTTNPDGTAPTFTITATGTSPSATINAAGAATLTATTVSAVFNPKNAAGTSVLPVAKQNIACTYDAGQSLVLTTLSVPTSISKNLNVHCTIPVAGVQAYTAKVTATTQFAPKAGSTVSLSNFKISLLINSTTTDALQTLGATTLQGSINAAASLTDATPSALAIAATVPTTAVPQTTNPDGTAPTFTITATGTSPTAKINAAGNAVLTATTVSAVFNPKNAAGTSVLPVAKQNIACTYDAGQSLVLNTYAATA